MTNLHKLLQLRSVVFWNLSVIYILVVLCHGESENLSVVDPNLTQWFDKDENGLININNTSNGKRAGSEIQDYSPEDLDIGILPSAFQHGETPKKNSDASVEAAPSNDDVNLSEPESESSSSWNDNSNEFDLSVISQKVSSYLEDETVINDEMESVLNISVEDSLLTSEQSWNSSSNNAAGINNGNKSKSVKDDVRSDEIFSILNDAHSMISGLLWDSTPSMIPDRSWGASAESQPWPGGHAVREGLQRCLRSAGDSSERLVACLQEQLVAALRRIVAAQQARVSLASSRSGDGVQVGLELEQGRRKKTKQKLSQLQRLLPMLLIPFAIQALVLPWFLASLKMMALKSVLVGKLAILVTLFNYLRSQAARNDHDIYQENMALEHYGYDGGTEFGAWLNGNGGARRRRGAAYRGRRR